MDSQKLKCNCCYAEVLMLEGEAEVSHQQMIKCSLCDLLKKVVGKEEELTPQEKS